MWEVEAFSWSGKERRGFLGFFRVEVFCFLFIAFGFFIRRAWNKRVIFSGRWILERRVWNFRERFIFRDETFLGWGRDIEIYFFWFRLVDVVGVRFRFFGVFLFRMWGRGVGRGLGFSEFYCLIFGGRFGFLGFRSFVAGSGCFFSAFFWVVLN